MRTQAELAVKHGIAGFCVYLDSPGELGPEHPVEVLHANKDINLSYCVCLGRGIKPQYEGPEAGLDSAQRWCGAQASKFLGKVAKYMSDTRYLRIDGKPLLVVACTDLDEEVEATAYQLRLWGREKNVGELNLSRLRTSASDDSVAGAFDAIIDLPPNNSMLDLTTAYPGVSPKFRGRICDWRQLMQDSEEAVADHSSKRFLGVNPGWDNTPRAGENATVYVGSSPDLFQLWLDRTISRTSAIHSNESERLIFLNAWNDWLNGASIEPGEKSGFANLIAVRNAVARQTMSLRLAVSVHAFYPEILPEILHRVQFMPPGTKLFVSCRPEDTEAVRAQVHETGREYRIYRVANRGRDVAPFLQMLGDIDAQGFSLVAKVHTKKSPQFDGGEKWRAELFDSVLGLGSFNRALGAFIDDPTLGMVGPTQHFLPMSAHLESNERHIFEYCSMLGFNEEEVMSRGFFAGTMFIARVAAIRRVLDLGLNLERFEPEAGQTNGTLAHGLERVLSVCVNASGFRHGGHWNPAAEVRLNFKNELLNEVERIGFAAKG